MPQVAIPGLSGVGLLHVSATLTTNNTPLASKTVTFTSGKTKLCTAQTNTKGVAACQISVLQEVVVLLNNSYTATFNGDTGYTASTASTPAITVTSSTVRRGPAAVTPHITRQRSGRWPTRTATTPHSYAPTSSTSSTTNTINPRTQRAPRAAHPRPGAPRQPTNTPEITPRDTSGNTNDGESGRRADRPGQLLL